MRILKKDLEILVKKTNELTNSPIEYASNKDGEKFKANLGHFHLDGAYGGWKLVRTMSEGGGIEEITYGFVSKKELFDKMHAYIRGLEFNFNNGGLK